MGMNQKYSLQDIQEICEIIALQPEMKEKVLHCYQNFDYGPYEESIKKIYSRSTWEQGIEELKEGFLEDPDGVIMLACLLGCAAYTHSVYQEMNISDRIFADTMKFCTRFVGEQYAVYGVYQFVWGWWFPRQLSMCEFRIGELEYEMMTDDSRERCISIHIPSDASMQQSALRKSYEDAILFFKTYYPEYEDAYMFCDSWLLSPELKGILPKSSRIIQFQENFEVSRVNTESDGCMPWIFKRGDIPVEELPEETTLQRGVKRHLLNGGTIGWAYGRLKKEPFM